MGYLDSPATVEAFEFLTSLITTWGVAPPAQFLRSGDPLRIGRFYLGRQAMLASAHWHLPRLTEYEKRGRIEIGVLAIPHREGAEPTSVLYTSGWAVPSNVRHKRLAVELAAYLAGADAQRFRASSRLEIPALRSVANAIASEDPTGVEAAFLSAVASARMPWGATVLDFHEIEEMSSASWTATCFAEIRFRKRPPKWLAPSTRFAHDDSSRTLRFRRLSPAGGFFAWSRATGTRFRWSQVGSSPCFGDERRRAAADGNAERCGNERCFPGAVANER